jgi:hypothetical protein
MMSHVMGGVLKEILSGGISLSMVNLFKYPIYYEPLQVRFASGGDYI